MDPETRRALERELAAMADDFAAGLPARMTQIEAAWQQAAQARWRADSLDSLYRLCHSLAGAGGTFGLPAVGEAARDLTEWLRPLQHGPADAVAEPRPELLEHLRDTVRAVTARG